MKSLLSWLFLRGVFRVRLFKSVKQFKSGTLPLILRFLLLNNRFVGFLATLSLLLVLLLEVDFLVSYMVDLRLLG